ncbi:MAG: L-serine ammonia-lyase [Candidatus Marinimicrobia bacterium]|nr:L-serine ammonia-lyase [Candidatus Neomarinimicrobiota bacterium]|tara:strand:+ start:1882 stop:3231 length:1350 start_codon:yes stop_codon:yes gene_type:complete
MYTSLFDIFKIGLGPSSSHTVGPMIASNNFLDDLINNNILDDVDKIDVELYGSLAHTGLGHKTHEAIIVGLTGEKPHNIDKERFDSIVYNNRKTKYLHLSTKKIFFSNNNIKLNKKHLKEIHSNALKYTAFLKNKKKYTKTYYSIGGGFVISENEEYFNKNVKFDFNNANELLILCKKNNLTISDMIISNECQYSSTTKDAINKRIINIWKEMNNTINSGVKKTGLIDNILNVERRANSLYQNLKKRDKYDPLEVLDWVNIFAIATCEENASGARIVTSPTNGASGIIPATLKYYVKFIKNSNDDGIINFLTTASAIAILFKNNASISGAEVGCQGEVGVACSMAAAGLTSALGGNINQIENAAEIAMEHNLGLTCDPVKGLVQIPCIERNSMGAIKAINASRLALSGSGVHNVSLDQVIKTMNETGKSMNTIFKETSLGGLAVNVIEC